VKLLLSYRDAARLLGIGRGSSLHALIRSGLLRPVTLLGRRFIPREQVEQLARVGERPSQESTKAGRQKPSGSIRDIKL
jgi:predicted site-specific integrase-resolvase